MLKIPKNNDSLFACKTSTNEYGTILSEFLQSVAFTQVHLSFLINVNCVIKKPLLSLFVANNSMYKMNTQQEKNLLNVRKLKQPCNQYTSKNSTLCSTTAVQ